MKYLLGLNCLLLSHCLIAQPDSLKKYSYYVYGYTIHSNLVYTYTGSAYFVRTDNKLFLITAQHVLNGCHSNTEDTCKPPMKPRFFPDQMAIFLNIEGKLSYNSFVIDVSKIRNNSTCIWAPLGPDIVAYEIPGHIPDTIYSIEKFLHSKLPKKKKDVSMYGFPAYANKLSNGEDFVNNSTNLFIDNYTFYNWYKFQDCNKKDAIDSIDYLIRPFTKVVSDSLSGYSGSPVFIRKKKKWFFLGTFASTVGNDKLLFVKSEFTLWAIRNCHN